MLNLSMLNNIKDDEVVPLLFLKVGEGGIVEEIRGGKGVIHRLNSLGIIPGLHLTVAHISFGLLAVKVNGGKVALGRGVALKILVRKIIKRTNGEGG